MAPVWLLNVGKAFSPLLRWIGVKVLIPWLLKIGTSLIKRWKARTDYKKKAEQNKKANENYENNPSDDSFGGSAQSQDKATE